MEVLNLKGVTLVRFVTTTHGWAERARNHICVPEKWQFMLVELLVADGGDILMSTAIGIPKSSVHPLNGQGLYYYEFAELPEAVVAAITGHFRNVYKELLRRVDTLLPGAPKPRLMLVKA